MGSIGKTGLEKFLMGSVAEKVVHDSKLPVLIVR
jgi:nucleotide-binding universal stress UspA family protein